MTGAGRFGRAEELYHAALEHRPGDRDRFLAGACGDDQELLREVRSLLACADEAQALLEEPPGAAETRAIRSDTTDRLVGRRLGHYEVLSPLGAGGMGEVYRARDTTLGREVALKVLPEGVARDTDRVSRFRDEARVLASLNHPNVAVLYGFEEADGERFLALELVEGETLKERLERGAIPVGEALGIARQIAEGLEAAHDSGVVHRDLKPANVALTPEGRVKVLDFGLARVLVGPATGAPAASAAPTLAHTATEAGLVLGTAAYMSPEQAGGKPVDRRGDVWAFGVLLWEMLAGRAPFAGDGVPEILAAVTRDDPDWSRLPASTPPPVLRLLRRCLQKDPGRRLRDVADARLELEDALSGVDADRAGQAVAEPAEPGRPTLRRWLWAAGGLLVGGLATATILTSLDEDAGAPAVHFTFDAPMKLTDAPAVSPDGRHVACTGVGDESVLWVRALDSLDARPLEGTWGATQAFWSPDGAWIAFFQDSELKRIRPDGRGIDRICALPGDPVRAGTSVKQGTWGSDDTIVFADRGALFAVPASGGDARPLTTLDASRGETRHLAPWFLPGSRQLLFVIQASEVENAGLYLTTLDAPAQRHRLHPRAVRAAFASGHLLFVEGTTLRARPFDPQTLRMTGEPVPVVSNVASWEGLQDWGLFGVSPHGVLAWRQRRLPNVELAWLDRDGTRLATVGQPGLYGQVALSPDGRQVAVEIQDKLFRDLWVMDLGRGVKSRVASSAGKRENPVWSPDSKALAFAAGENLDIHQMGLEGGASEIPLLETADLTWPEDWSRDGETLLLVTTDALWALSPGQDTAPRAVSSSTADLAEPRLSPDGRWLAYISLETGQSEVYVEPYGRPGERVRVSIDGGGQPEWRSDGKELFYLTWPEARLTAVDVEGGTDRIEVSPPRDLFPVEVVTLARSDDYAVDADGQRFLVKIPVGEAPTSSMHVVTDWPSLLGER